MRCDYESGPVFGRNELYLSEPFNKENACISFEKHKHYKIKVNEEGKNLFTGQKSD